MKQSVRVVLRQDDGNWENVCASILSVAQSGFSFHATLLTYGDNEALAAQCARLAADGILQDWERFDLGASQNWFDAANSALPKSGGDEILLFLSSRAILEAGAFAGLLRGFHERPEAAGANPILMYAEKRKICHLGTVADSQGSIHHLYEGMDAGHTLAGKERFFQLAHDAVFMTRRGDFLKAGGFRPDLGALAFYDFCLRLLRNRPAGFITVPYALASTGDIFNSWESCGLWNSLLDRGKLSPDSLTPDYYLKVEADGLEYGLDAWLNEGDSAWRLYAGDSPFFAWRHEPSPRTFLGWLKTLAEKELAKAVELARYLPASLPRYFGFYQALARKKLAFAQKNKFASMSEKIDAWLKSSRIFHYRELKQGINALQQAGFYSASLDNCPSSYDAWIEIEENNRPARLEEGRQWPEISLVMPVWNPRPEFFLQALESVYKQDYPDWQLCIADDASTDIAVHEILREAAKKDKRIKIVFRKENGHISRATNSALELVDTPWAAFMDHDDLLAPSALFFVAKAIGENPHCRMIYTDEDRVDIWGVRRTPVFRPDREPGLSGHLSAFSTDLLRETGGLRTGLEGAQDTDLFLRVEEKLEKEQIIHIPRILYHWRVHEESTAGSIASKPYAVSANMKAKLEAAIRRNYAVRIIPSKNSSILFKTAYEIGKLNFSIILFGNKKRTYNDKLAECIKNLKKTYAPEVLWQALEKGSEAEAELADCIDKKLSFTGRSLKKAILSSADQAKNNIIIFIHADLEPLADCRPEQLACALTRPEVGAVGGLLWRQGRLWHGGLYPNRNGLPFPLLRGIGPELLKAFCWGRFLNERKTIGVSWRLMALRKEALEVFAGINEKMGAYAECAFSLALEEKGLLTLASPWGQWNTRNSYNIHEQDEEGQKTFLASWGEKVKNHPLLNPNLEAASDYDWGLVFKKRS